ncbi:tRNA uridine 5-carboxymethylaminomethyl modification enzyme MnmG [Trichinella pseudospiralis]
MLVNNNQQFSPVWPGDVQKVGPPTACNLIDKKAQNKCDRDVFLAGGKQLRNLVKSALLAAVQGVSVHQIERVMQQKKY